VKKSGAFQTVLTVVTLLGVGVGAYKYLSGEEVLEALGRFEKGYVLPILALSTLYLGLQAWRLVPLLRPLIDLPSGTVFRAYLAGTGATLLPGGVAVRLGLLKQAGAPVSVTTAPLIVVSLLDQAAFLFGGLLAAIWTPQARGPALAILGGLVVFVFLLRFGAVRAWLGRRLAALAGRFGLGEKVQTFAGAWQKLGSLPLLAQTFGITLVAFALKIVMLDLCLRGLGWTLPYPLLFAAFILPTLLGRLSPLPAGVGVTEAGMVGMLVAGSTINESVAFVGVALFRVASVLYQALLGALVFFFAWRGEREAGRH